MARRKKCVQLPDGSGAWVDFRNPWPLPEQPEQTNDYLYSNPGYYTWDNQVLNYHHDFLNRKNPGMANVVPWLLSMTLLGVQQFPTNAGSSVLARDVQPQIAKTLPPLLPGFHASLRNYKALIASHDELPEHITCNPLEHENSVDRLPTTPEYNNHLYGSTPETGEFYVPPKRIGPQRPSGRAFDIFKTDPHSVNQLGTHAFNYAQPIIEDEYVGSAMELVYAWPTVDFEYDSIEARDSAIYDGDYVPENNLPLGLEVWKDKVFITLPKWKDGIPVTLATVPKNSKTKSPKLTPYPSWDWHRAGNCEGLTSVFRVQVDECNRLWVLDSGKVNITKKLTQQCPPALFIFDLTTDTLIRKYTFPEEQVKQDSLYTNIVVDIRNEECNTAKAYLSDVFRYGLVVYDFPSDTSFRIDHHLFYPDPLASRYELHGMKFQWTDGIFGIAISPVDIHEDRTLFFHPMSSFREFAVSTSTLRDKRTAENNSDKFIPIGKPRAKDYGHSSGSVIDKNGVMFFNMVTRDSVWCWDTRKEYIPQNLGVVGHSNVSLVFPNDIKVDHEYDQNIWMISNRLPMYLYGSIDSSKINYRVYKANAREAVKNTVCDPDHVVADGSHGYDETC